MTGADFILDVRNFLGDVPWRTSTSNLIYDDSEIILAAETQRDLMVKMLWFQPRSPEQPFQMAVTRMVKSVSTTANGGAVPSDFWNLLAGAGSDGHYIPEMSGERVESYLEAGDDLVSVRFGLFVGTAASATYVGLPQSPIAKNSASFTDFSDSFYEVLELLTVNELLKKPERGVADRMNYLVQPIAQGLASLL